MTTEHNRVSAAATRSDTETSKRSAKGILCAKCEHVNRAGSTTCSRCGSHLHIKCNDCGAVNERALTSCKNCGRALRKGFLARAAKRFAAAKLRFKFLHLVVFVAVVGLIFWLVVTLTGLQLPKAQ